MQKALLPVRYTWVTQGINGSYSHSGTKAIDFGSLKRYVPQTYNLFAPFDCQVVWADTIAKGGTVALQSLTKVKWADGTIDYMTVISEHSNDRPEEGRTFKQGEIYATMGTAGNVAKHCHIEVQKGIFVKPTGTRYQAGIKAYVYVFPNTVNPYDALFITEDTVIDKASVVSYPWKVAQKTVDPVARDTKKNQLKVLVDLLRVRTDHTTSSDAVGFVELNGIYDDLETVTDGFIWHRIGDGQWIADNGEWLELLPGENETLKKQIDALSDEIVRLKADISDRDSLVATLRAKMNAALNENKKLQLMYDDLLEDHDKAVAMYEQLSEEYTITKKKISDAYDRLIEAFKEVM